MQLLSQHIRVYKYIHMHMWIENSSIDHAELSGSLSTLICNDGSNRSSLQNFLFSDCIFKQGWQTKSKTLAVWCMIYHYQKSTEWGLVILSS